MYRITPVLTACLLILGGCMYNEEPMPVIVSGTETPAIPSGDTSWSQGPGNVSYQVPGDWMPPAGVEKRWTAIIIHHSATDNGNAAIFDKWHKEENHWDGIGYDFVIGNGTDSGNGQIEVTFRWLQQIPGAHCGGTPGNWANVDGIGICLVGNFDKKRPTERQMQSLAKLVSFLQKRYGIPDSRIYGHRTAPGARVTDCPGKNFSFAELKSMLN